MNEIDIVFDGPPGHIAGRFVEVENQDGHSISVGEWIERDDGYWVLRIETVVSDGEMVEHCRQFSECSEKDRMTSGYYEQHQAFHHYFAAAFTPQGVTDEPV